MSTRQPATQYPGGESALLERVRQVSGFEAVCREDAPLLSAGVLAKYETGECVLALGEPVENLILMFEGVAGPQVGQSEECKLPVANANEPLGEIPMLSGNPAKLGAVALTPVTALLLPKDTVWQLMLHCPAMRTALVGRIVSRVSDYHQVALEREKMIAIGTLTAGLMHELNNPGAAARRATSQLRQNLRSLHELSMRLSEQAHSDEQKACVRRLLAEMYAPRHAERSSLEVMDREQSFCEWMEQSGIPDCWKIAPVLASSDLEMPALECARSVLPKETFSDALHWLEALGSSSELLQTIETSMQRITDLVGAVKTYSSGASDHEAIDLKASMRAAWLIVAHKFKQKSVEVVKSYPDEMPMISAPGIAQVWTNLLDNAADAVPEQGGRVQIRSSVAGGKVVVEIEDNGAGIAPENLPHVFTLFFTTKPAGKGTGMGLDIVARTVRAAGGEVSVESEPGRTVFRVTLPVVNGADRVLLQKQAQSEHA